MFSQLVCKRWYSLIQSVNTTMNTILFPCFDGSPYVGEHSLKEYTIVVDRKFTPHMPAVLLQIKFKSKGHWTCWQSIPCVQMTLQKVKPCPPPLPAPYPNLYSYFSLCFLWSYSMWEVWNGTWRFMVAYHFCIDQTLFFLLVDMIFATCGRCEMIHGIRHGGISFLHWSLNFVPVIWYYSI